MKIVEIGGYSFALPLQTNNHGYVFDAEGNFFCCAVTPEIGTAIVQLISQKFESAADQSELKPPAVYKFEEGLSREEINTAIRIVAQYGIEKADQVCYCGHNLSFQHFHLPDRLNPYKDVYGACQVSSCACSKGRKIVVKESS